MTRLLSALLSVGRPDGVGVEEDDRDQGLVNHSVYHFGKGPCEVGDLSVVEKGPFAAARSPNDLKVSSVEKDSSLERAYHRGHVRGDVVCQAVRFHIFSYPVHDRYKVVARTGGVSGFPHDGYGGAGGDAGESPSVVGGGIAVRAYIGGFHGRSADGVFEGVSALDGGVGVDEAGATLNGEEGVCVRGALQPVQRKALMASKPKVSCAAHL